MAFENWLKAFVDETDKINTMTSSQLNIMSMVKLVSMNTRWQKSWSSYLLLMRKYKACKEGCCINGFLQQTSYKNLNFTLHKSQKQWRMFTK